MFLRNKQAKTKKPAERPEFLYCEIIRARPFSSSSQAVDSPRRFDAFKDRSATVRRIWRIRPGGLFLPFGPGLCGGYFSRNRKRDIGKMTPTVILSFFNSSRAVRLIFASAVFTAAYAPLSGKSSAQTELTFRIAPRLCPHYRNNLLHCHHRSHNAQRKDMRRISISIFLYRRVISLAGLFQNIDFSEMFRTF